MAMRDAAYAAAIAPARQVPVLVQLQHDVSAPGDEPPAAEMRSPMAVMVELRDIVERMLVVDVRCRLFDGGRVLEPCWGRGRDVCAAT